MSLTAIPALKYLIKIALNIELPESFQEKDYIEILKMVKKIKVYNKLKTDLLIILFEQMFIENGKFKKIKKEDEIKNFISYCNAKSYSKEMENNSDFIAIKKVFDFSIFNKSNALEINLIYLIMQANKFKSPLLFFRCLEAVYSEKDKYYIKNNKIVIDKETPIEEIEEYISHEKEIKLNVLLKFINKKIQEYEKKNVIIQRNVENNIKGGSQQEINLLKKQLDDLKAKNKNLENKISELFNHTEKKISELSKYKIDSEKKISDSEKKLSELKKASEINIQRIQAECNKKIENYKKSQDDRIRQLYQNIQRIKELNNSLNLKSTNLEKDKNELTQHLVYA